MTVIANWRITTIEKGQRKTYSPGEMIAGLSPQEEARLLAQGAASKVKVVSDEDKKVKKKKDAE